jgi:hypothetical protein
VTRPRVLPTFGVLIACEDGTVVIDRGRIRFGPPAGATATAGDGAEPGAIPL